MVKVAPIDHSAINVIRLAEAGHYLTRKGIIQLSWLERTFRPILSRWIDRVDTVIQSCARRSLTCIADTFSSIKIAHARFVLSLVLDELRPTLDSLKKTCRKAHTTTLNMLSSLFGFDVQHLRPGMKTRWAVAELYLHGAEGFPKDLHRAQTLLLRHEIPGEGGAQERTYEFLVKGVAAGHPEAKFILGCWHEEGIGDAEKDLAFANRLITEAAEEGFGPAIRHLKGKERAEPRMPSPPPSAEGVEDIALTEQDEGESVAISADPAAMQLAVYSPETTLGPSGMMSTALARFRKPAPPPLAETDIRLLRVEALKGKNKADAHLELALRFKGGIRGVEEDEEISFLHLRTAAVLGSEKALCILCMQFEMQAEAAASRENGEGGSAEPQRGEIKEDYPPEIRGQTLVWTGHFFLNQSSPHYNPDYAITCFRRASRLGCAEGTHAKGLYYEQVKGQSKKAKRKFKRAARGGGRRGTRRGAPPPEAQYELGLTYMFASTKKRPDYKKARAQFELAAAEKYPAAMYQLAILLMEGKGGPKETLRAEALLLEIERDFLEFAPGNALVRIGDLYRHGSTSVKRNLLRAFKLYEMGRKQSSVLAYVRVAEMYTMRSLHPMGTSNPAIDKQKAFSLLKEGEQLERIKKIKNRGALSGGEAAFAFGMAMEAGVVCTKNPQLALSFIFIAAREGCLEAWKKVENIYLHGELGIDHLVPKRSAREKKAHAIYDFVTAFERDRRFNSKKLPKLFADS